jgi:hypothetical protein
MAILFLLGAAERSDRWARRKATEISLAPALAIEHDESLTMPRLSHIPTQRRVRQLRSSKAEGSPAHRRPLVGHASRSKQMAEMTRHCRQEIDHLIRRQIALRQIRGAAAA